MSDWNTTACILCECNCGIEVRLDGRRFARIRGDKAHPASKGYTCEKALRLDHYQNSRDRITSPLRRRADGSYEEVGWDTAIAEVAARLAGVRDTHGGETILYYGGGGQGNHLGGAYSTAVRAVLGARYRSNALAQEKTGEFWVNTQMFGAGAVRGDFEHAEVALFIGKNPWHSHGIAEARRTLKALANDPERSLIVIDPRRSETADLADHHLQVKPGTDAFCLAAIGGILAQDGLFDAGFVAEHTSGSEPVLAALRQVPVANYAERCGIDESELQTVARRIAGASSVAVFEDLGIQQAPHSTLASYLEKLVWVITGNFGREGAQYIPTTLVPLARGTRSKRVSPVTGAGVIGGMIPCNVIADEILTDHPDRFRAMIVESANPVHSLTDSGRMREALDALDFVVVIDIAFTETARHADYVLPAASQYEKWEATFFNFEFPQNTFQLRAPLLEPLSGTLPEPEIHTRLVRALGALDDEHVASLRELAESDRAAFAMQFGQMTTADPLLGRVAPVLLHETVGQTLPEGAAAASVLWAAAHRCAMTYPDAVRRAGHEGEGLELGENLFRAILQNRSGVVITASDYEDTWRHLGTGDGKINVAIPELLDALTALVNAPAQLTSDEYPFVLAAGERRSFTANTIFRDPEWRKRDRAGALRMNPADASDLGVADGGMVKVTTAGGSVTTVVEISDTLQPGHVTLPNGLGVDYPADDNGERALTGVAPNELTITGPAVQDAIAATPFHKHVPARVEAVPEPV